MRKGVTIIKTLFYRLFALSFCVFRIFPLQPRKVALLAPHRELGSLAAVRDVLAARGGWRIVCLPVHDALRHPLRLFTSQAFHLATAGAVLLNDNFMPMADLPFSSKAKVIQLWHAEGALKRFGLSLPLEPRLAERVRRGCLRCTAVVCASEAIVPYYAEAFGVPERRVLPLGSPRLDALSAPMDRAALRTAFEARYPECRGKRLILYAPTIRDENAENAALLSRFDFAAFAARFGSEATLLLRMHPKVRVNPGALPACVLDVTEHPDSLALLRLCDALVTDYSSLSLDAALLDLPIYCYTFDYDRYNYARGFYKELRALPPGPLVDDFPALLDALDAPDAGRELRQAFVRFHLGQPDGRAAERVADLVSE